ncbi:MAG: ABC transporter ATP-binding protein [bacterium]|nr:ABC transporter ATP-binding protein [bacterium]
MINVSGLTVRFGRTKALNEVKLSIDKGECILLAGANGSGKTTLLRAVAGVLRPGQGDIDIDGNKVGPATRAKTAYIPSSLSFFDNLKLKEAVSLHASFYSSFTYREIGDFVFDMNRKTGALSKGEKTLFFLSLALSTSPDYLLIDDVIHFLDPHLREIFLKTILQLIEEEQLSVIIAAQSAVDIEGVLERVVVMDKGKVVLDDTVESLKKTFVRLYAEKVPPDFPVVFQKDWEGMKEFYIYPFEPHMESGTGSDTRLEYLALAEILRAFIGGEYVTH